MEKVINLLSDIEEKANKILNRTSEEKSDLEKELIKNIEALENNIDLNTQKELDRLKATMDKELTVELDQLIKDSTKNLAEIELAFKTNHDLYVEQIFQNITK